MLEKAEEDLFLSKISLKKKFFHLFSRFLSFLNEKFNSDPNILSFQAQIVSHISVY
jgi:hypothetical protein